MAECGHLLRKNGIAGLNQLMQVYFEISELKRRITKLSQKLKIKMVMEQKACAFRNYHRMIGKFRHRIPLSFWEISTNRQVWSSYRSRWVKNSSANALSHSFKFCEHNHLRNLNPSKINFNPSIIHSCSSCASGIQKDFIGDLWGYSWKDYLSSNAKSLCRLEYDSPSFPMAIALVMAVANFLP